MKRFIIALVAMGFMGMFAACKKDEKKGDEAPKATDTDEAKPDEAKPDETKPDEAKPDETATDETATDEAAPAGDTATGIAECDSYIKRVMACDKFPQQGKDALSGSTDAWKQAGAAGAEAGKAAGDACKAAETAADEALKAMGC